MSAPDDRPEPQGNRWSIPRLSIDVSGAWFHEGVEITHPGILRGLRSDLRRDERGYFIQTRVRVPVEVADTPYVVVRFEKGDGAYLATLNDDTVEAVDPATLRIGPSDIPYCAVKGGRFEARFSRAAAFQLLDLAIRDPRLGRATAGARAH